MQRLGIMAVALGGLASLGACSASPHRAAEVQAADWSAAYVEYIRATMDADGIPGLAIALIQNGEIILAEGYGWRDLAARAPVTPETLFHIGSTQKSMTALAIASLVDEGLLDWDEPVVAFAPEFALSEPRATATVTLRHLLSMTSGIPAAAEDEFDGTTAAEVFDWLRAVPLLGQPGEDFSYSNLATAADGYLGAIAAGSDPHQLESGYAQLLQTRVLDPIGMTTATLSVGAARASGHYARSYTLSAAGEPVLAASEDVEDDELAPAGGLKANIRELALYMVTQLNRGIAPNGDRVVSADNLLETWQPYRENYALGWEVQTYAWVEIVAHDGAYDNFASVIGFVPELEVGFAILLNSELAGEELLATAPEVLVDLLLAESGRDRRLEPRLELD